MMEIFTTKKEEYERVKKIFKNQHDIRIYEPKDSYAIVKWSIDDLRGYFPKDTDKELDAALKIIEDQLREDMIDRGWDTIEALNGEMKSAIEEISIKNYDVIGE